MNGDVGARSPRFRSSTDIQHMRNLPLPLSCTGRAVSVAVSVSLCFCCVSAIFLLHFCCLSVVFLSSITRVQVPGREKPPTRCPNDKPATAEAARFKQKGRTEDGVENDEMDSEDEFDSVKDSYYPGLFTKVLHIPMYEPGFENKVRRDESHHAVCVQRDPRW